jgi:hypothetical protein
MRNIIRYTFPCQAADLTSAPGGRRSSAWIWGCALASVMAIVVAYYFAFSAAHQVQIKDVPLATQGGRR